MGVNIECPASNQSISRLRKHDLALDGGGVMVV